MRCKQAIHALRKDTAGRQGPIRQEYYYQAMCTSYCRDSDTFHQAALFESGCTCQEISVTDDDTADDDKVNDLFCNRNSARMLCDVHGLCGVWDCPTSDFMCPRYEYNRVFVDSGVLGGGLFGDCSTNGARSQRAPALWAWVSTLVLAAAAGGWLALR
eukprot:FR741848.1.p1 GENE.FR741848.1~~FR741848.1.p1  ORF type:complete len:177 (+),score=10.66 FR741848.1:59-532(+)